MDISETKELYVTILLTTVILAFFCQSRFSKKKVRGFYAIPFVLSFVTSWFFYAFNDVGNDYEEYCFVFDMVDFSTYNSLWIEPGYALLNAFIKLFTPNSVIGIAIIKTIISVLVFIVIYDFRKHIDISVSVLAYMSLMYLDSFCMIRIHLAAAIILFALDIYINRDWTILPLVMYFVACTIHYSAVTLLPVIAAYVACNKSVFNTKLIVVFAVGLIVLNNFAIPLMESILASISFLMKYNEKYGEITMQGSGLMQYVYHLPVVLLLAVLWNKIPHKEQKIYQIALVLLPFSLFFGILGYSIEVIGRTFVYYVYIWMICVAKYAYDSRNTINEIIIIPLCIFVLIFRFIDYLNNALISAGINQFHLIVAF